MICGDLILVGRSIVASNLLETHVWTAITAISGRPPSKRYGHSLVFWGNSLWVYGGFDDFGYKSDELFQFNLGMYLSNCN
jgi:hypothetical protein